MPSSRPVWPPGVRRYWQLPAHSHTQLVGNRMRVGRDRCEPERRRGGTTVARPVEGNEPDAALGRKLLPKAKVQPGTRGPVQINHHGATGYTRVTHAQNPAAAIYIRLAYLMTIAMPSAPGSPAAP
jgi:hypothetical protein